jgi:hypothetical protein
MYSSGALSNSQHIAQQYEKPVSQTPASQNNDLTSTGWKDLESGLHHSDQIAPPSKPSGFLKGLKGAARHPGRIAVGALALAALKVGSSHLGSIRAPRPDLPVGHGANEFAGDGLSAIRQLYKDAGVPGFQADEGYRLSLDANLKALIEATNRPIGKVNELIGEGSPSSVQKEGPLSDGERQQHPVRLEFLA